MTTGVISPPLQEIYNFIAKVPAYPVSVGKLLELGRDLKVPDEILDFYDRFSHGLVFKSKDDLIGSSEQVDIMREEGTAMPAELERSPEEY
jgi:hypothetical protein